MNTSERKREIREWVAQRRRSLTEEQRREASGRLRKALQTLPLWAEANRLAAFWPLGKEPDISPLLRIWVRRGKVLALPRVEGSDPNAIQLYRISDPAVDLVSGTLGILEPDPSRCAIHPADALDWIWVPGTAFDHTCARMGRGKGYYDSLLSRTPSGVYRVGIAYDWQVLDARLPRDPWDQPLNSVVTDRRVIPSADAAGPGT